MYLMPEQNWVVLARKNCGCKGDGCDSVTGGTCHKDLLVIRHAPREMWGFAPKEHAQWRLRQHSTTQPAGGEAFLLLHVALVQRPPFSILGPGSLCVCEFQLPQPLKRGMSLAIQNNVRTL